MAKEFLQLVDGAACLQERRGERMAKDVGGDSFIHAYAPRGGFQGFSERVFVQMMAAHDASARVATFIRGGPQPEPRPFTTSARELPFQTVGQEDGRSGLGAIGFPRGAAAVEVGHESRDD